MLRAVNVSLKIVKMLAEMSSHPDHVSVLSGLRKLMYTWISSADVNFFSFDWGSLELVM